MTLDWSRDLLLPVGLGVMMGCVVLALVSLIERMVSTPWHGEYLVIFCALTAIEACYSARIRHFGPAVRIVELAAIYVLVQMADALANGHEATSAILLNLTPGTIAISVLVVAVWLAAKDVVPLIDQLGDTRFPLSPYENPGRKVAARFFVGGILLFVLAGLDQEQVAQALHLPDSGTSGPVANVFLYFLLGTLILGYVHYATLRHRWRMQQVTIIGTLGGSWARYTVAFVLIVLIVAFLLPTSQTMGLVDIAHTTWNQFIAWFWKPLSSWFPGAVSRPTQLPMPKHLPPKLPPYQGRPPVRHASHGRGTDWLLLIRAGLFWGAVLIALGLLIRELRARRPGGGIRLPTARMPAFGFLHHLWQSLVRLLRRSREAIADRLPQGMPRQLHSAGVTGRLPRFVRIGSLSPRDQVLYYYLSTVRRARRHGFVRQPSQTPREFGAALSPQLPDAQADLTLLTDAFIEARYSRREVDQSGLDGVRTSWQQVRTALRKAKKG